MILKQLDLPNVNKFRPKAIEIIQRILLNVILNSIVYICHYDDTLGFKIIMSYNLTLKEVTCSSPFPPSMKSKSNFLLWNRYVAGDDGNDSSYKLVGGNYSIPFWNISHLEFSMFCLLIYDPMGPIILKVPMNLPLPVAVFFKIILNFPNAYILVFLLILFFALIWHIYSNYKPG